MIVAYVFGLPVCVHVNEKIIIENMKKRTMDIEFFYMNFHLKDGLGWNS